MGLCTEDRTNNLKDALSNLINEAVDSKKNPKSYLPGLVLGITDADSTKYLKAVGTKTENGELMEEDSLFCLFSCTKAITCTGILQLWERGLLDLDKPVKEYLPSMSKVGQFDGYNDNGSLKLKKPKTDVTMRMLLTHTSGFAYPFSNHQYKKSLDEKGQPNFEKFTKETFDNTFLVFEPGTDWEYGMGIDWAGLVVEAITGQSLGEYLNENIFRPAKMHSFTFHVKTENQLKKLVPISMRDSKNFKVTGYQPELDPELDLGGQGLFGTVDDYLKFLRIWLNEGMTDDGFKILKQETYSYAIKSHLPDGMRIKGSPALIRNLSLGSTEDPSVESDSWNLVFALNPVDLPTGRPKGSVHWSGLANLFFWIDPHNKIGTFYASQVLPSGEISSKNVDLIEKCIYKYIK